MTLVCVPGTVISRAHWSRIRYEAVPVLASQARETVHDVLPVERRLNGPDGTFLLADDANSGESGAIIDAVSGTVASRHAAAAMRIDPAVVTHLTNRRIEAPWCREMTSLNPVQRRALP